MLPAVTVLAAAADASFTTVRTHHHGLTDRPNPHVPGHYRLPIRTQEEYAQTEQEEDP